MSRQTKFCIFAMLVAVAAVLLAPHVSRACPTCKEGLDANDPEHAGMVQGYFYSIIFMMSMPYILFTSFGLYMWRQVKRARAQKAAAAGVSAQASQTTYSSDELARSIHEERAPSESAELVEV